MSPLWAAVRQPILDYSLRLDHIFNEPERSAAERVADMFRGNSTFLQRLVGPETSLEEFLAGPLKGVTPETYNSIRVQHRGIALALLGENSAALDYLAAAVARFVPERAHPYGDRIREITGSLAEGDGNHIALITNMEAEAAAAIGLTRPIVA